MPSRGDIDLGFATAMASQGDHIAYFWETEEEFCRAVQFLAAGLKRHDAAVIFGHAEANGKVVAELQRLGFDVDALTAEGRIAILDGTPDRKQMLGNIGAAFTALQSAGAPLVRLLGNIGWGRQGWPSDDAILEFEAEVTGAAQQFPCLVMCMYSVGSVSGRVMLRGALETHPLTCCGNVLRENPLFVPLPDYLDRLRRPA